MNVKSLLCIGLVCTLATSCINKADDPMDPDSRFWSSIEPVTGFHAPWDGLENLTEFRYAISGGRLYFRYDAKDVTPVVSESFESERVVDDEDRVEVFFSPTPDMSRTYYCAEVDPMGRVMDYACDFYRQFDYEWNFETIETRAERTKGAYKVVISITLDEPEGLGIDFGGDCYIGVFQADFTAPDEVNWFSLKYVDVPEADFHKPDVLMPVRICI